MQFKVLTALTVALSATQVQANVAGDIADTFKQGTDVASNIAQVGATLNPFTIIAYAPRLVADFSKLATLIGQGLLNLGNPDDLDFDSEDQKKICDALSNFLVKVDDAIDVTVGEDSLIGQTPFVGVANTAISAVTTAIRNVLKGLLETVPSCAPKIEQQFQTITETYEIRFNNRLADQANVQAKVAELEEEFQ